MKRTLSILTFLLFAGVVIGQGTVKPEIDPQIVGRWDYVKTVNEDGSEEYSMIGLEHYYADGTVIFVDMPVKPFAKGKAPNTHEELVAAKLDCWSGLGTFETDKKNNLLSIRTVACNDPESLGESFEVKYEIKGDSIIFEDKYHFKKAKD
jgi:hypothetical protein